MEKEKTFVSDQQEFLWYAFKGEFGDEFKGNLGLILAFSDLEREREIKKERDRML